MPIRAVFFDAGDTLIHIWTQKADRFRWLCQQAGVTLPDDPELVRAGARAEERFVQNWRTHADAWSDAWFQRMSHVSLAEAGVTGDLGALAARIFGVRQGLTRTQAVDPEAIPLLEHLRTRGYRLAIVSNWDGSLVDALRPTGLSGYFDAVIDSAVIGSWKPDTRMFEIACAATGVSPAEAVHVGDSPGADVAGALAAGIRPVLLDSMDLFEAGFGDLPAFDRIRRLCELPALLEGY